MSFIAEIDGKKNGFLSIVSKFAVSWWSEEKERCLAGLHESWFCDLLFGGQLWADSIEGCCDVMGGAQQDRVPATKKVRQTPPLAALQIRAFIKSIRIWTS
jgi:hypothetical protein